jgi:hypothetical protein
MNKTLIWLLVAIIGLFIMGNGAAWYFLVYREEKNNSSTNLISNVNTNSANRNTNQGLANSNQNSNANNNSSSGVAAVKSVHCLQNPLKGKQIVINNLTDYSTVTVPFTFSGTANVFENTFQFRLRDCRGPVLKEGTITASGEAGANAIFSHTVSLTLSRSPMDVVLEVYELSMADNSEKIFYQVPLRLIKNTD